MTDDLMLMAYVDNELNQKGRRLIEMRIAQDPALEARLSRLQQTSELTKLSTVRCDTRATNLLTLGLMLAVPQQRGRSVFTREQWLLGTTLLLLGVVLGMILVTLFTGVSLASTIDPGLHRSMGGSLK